MERTHTSIRPKMYNKKVGKQLLKVVKINKGGDKQVKVTPNSSKVLFKWWKVVKTG